MARKRKKQNEKLHKRINVPFPDETYEIILNMSKKGNMSMNAVVRELVEQALKLQVSTDNIDLVTKIIREQLSVILKPSIERLASLSAKTCVQSSTAAYLTAETIARFVPDNLQMDVKEAYEAARKKGVEYTRRSLNNNEEI